MANFTGTTGNDALSGTLNDDIFNSTWLGGDDTMLGGLGNDTYNVDSIGDVVAENPNEGIDTVVSRVAAYTLTANVENLVLDNFGLFVPVAVNGTGNDLDNLITGNSRANALTGLDGSDTLKGLAGNDTLDGGSGNDTLDGGTGADSMTGGFGNDVFIVDSSSDVVVEWAFGGTDRVESSVTTTLGTFVENLTLTGTSAINGTGNASVNTIIGNDADNLLSGLGSNDTLTGNGGNDTLDGGTGNDTMTGGAGNDRYLVDSTADVVTEAANAGYDTVVAGVSWTLGANVEKLDQFAAVGNVNGTGNAGANTMIGNNADNLLQGLGGADTMLGSAGMDTLEGGQGGDTLRGGDGIDHLRAVDNFTAADSATDLFVFDTTPNSVTNYDYIDWANFVAGETSKDDQIELDHTVFGALTSSSSTTPTLGTLNASEFFSGAGSTGGALQDAVGIYQNTSNGYLYYNPTAGVAGDSVLVAILQTTTAGGGTALGAEEFTLI